MDYTEIVFYMRGLEEGMEISLALNDFEEIDKVRERLAKTRIERLLRNGCNHLTSRPCVEAPDPVPSVEDA